MDNVKKHCVERRFVLKPQKGQGSQGVRLLDFCGLTQEVEKLQRIGTSHQFLVEEFIDGTEVSIDAFHDDME